VTLTGRQVLAGVVSLVVAAAVITGVVILGAPSAERARRLDLRRVSDLEGIQNAVNFYYTERGKLPPSLEELAAAPGVRIGSDPVTGASYGYRALGVEEFELCGTFERVAEARVSSGVDVWQHPSGEHCFARKVTRRPPQ
jgi:hypothetical protein